MLTIDKNIPLPRHHLAGQRKKYPFDQMEIGDSLFVQAAAGEVQSVQTSLLGAALRHKPMKFATRQVPGGVRIWRTA